MATPLTFTEITVIVGAVTTSIVSIINAIGIHWGRDSVIGKLDQATKDRKEVKETLGMVQEQTNGALTKAQNRIIELENINRTLSTLIEKRHQSGSVLVPGAVPIDITEKK